MASSAIKLLQQKCWTLERAVGTRLPRLLFAPMRFLQRLTLFRSV
jgi:hypothetical protein